MLDSHLPSTGVKFTTTIAFLAVALMVSPLVVLASRPLSGAVITAGLATSFVCLALAWVNWKRYSQVTISSLGNLVPRGE